MGMHEDECECELCCKDAYLTMKTPVERIRAYLERVDERAVLALLTIQPEPFWMDFRILTRIVEHLLGL